MLELTIQDFVSLVGGRLTSKGSTACLGARCSFGRVVTDSRQIKPGDLFWALPGVQQSGATFAADAYQRGAIGVVHGERSRVDPWPGRWGVEVEDPLQALHHLAAESRRGFSGRVIAVTGSVGKTTTREMIHSVLSSRLTGTASPHNYNSQVGLPLSMLRWNQNDDYAVVELGASCRGQIETLANLCMPQLGTITCVGEAHLGEFGSQQTIAESKQELLTALPADGWAVLNRDDVWLSRMSPHIQTGVVWVGRSAESDLAATRVSSDQGKLRFCVGEQHFCIPVWGRHQLTSALIAIAMGLKMNLRLPDIARALANFQPPPLRCQVTNVGSVTVVNDTYNASPMAMRAALEVARHVNRSGKRIVVSGSMSELGGSSKAWHRRFGNQVVTVCGADVLIACGKYAQEVVNGAQQAGMPPRQTLVCRSPKEALPQLRSCLAADDVVLVKGSRVMAMEKLVDMLDSQTTRLAA